MSGRCVDAAWAACACCALWLSGSILSAAEARAQEEADPVLEVWFSVTASNEHRDEVIRGLGRELARTPQRHRARFLGASESVDGGDLASALAFFEVRLGGAGDRPTPVLEIGHAEDRVSPGWLVHAVLRAAETVGARVSVVDRRSSWIGQLVARSTRSLPPGPADKALEQGLPAAVLGLPRSVEPAPESSGEPTPVDASRLLAAIARRLDGLDGSPVFEDEFLVAAGRVWLRRDLYWLSLGLWLILFWRGRVLTPRSGGREFRWLFLVASLVAPVFAAVLLTLPAAVATWRPIARWPAVVALAPTGVYAIRLSSALLDGARVTIDAIPALLVAATLGIFARMLLFPRLPTPEPTAPEPTVD